jgi:CubicO group peptidase (beta-lactamase class C family)
VSTRARTAPAGAVATGYEDVREAFRLDLAERGDGGAALAAMVDGELVVDLWGGLADDRSGAAWQGDTAAVLFSGSKGLVATLLLSAVERGQLDLDSPVAGYWPEFAAAGKRSITVAEMASHRAGLPGVAKPLTAAALADPGGLAAALAAQAPLTDPGRPCYHALTYGWLCGELLRRVDGRGMGALVFDELAAPLGGLELAIGLRPGDPLSARLARLRRAPGYRLSAYLGGDPDPRLDLVYGNPPLAGEAWNDPALLAPAVPAVNAVATARAMATLYGRLVDGGGVPLRPESLDLGTRAVAEGDDPLSGRPLRFGPTGFELAGTPSALGPPADAFGHTGAGGSSHGAWPSLRTGFSYLTADLRSEDADGRAAALLAVLHEAVLAR